MASDLGRHVQRYSLGCVETKLCYYGAKSGQPHDISGQVRGVVGILNVLLVATRNAVNAAIVVQMENRNISTIFLKRTLLNK